MLKQSIDSMCSFKRHWPSYNIPFIDEITQMSGYWEKGLENKSVNIILDYHLQNCSLSVIKIDLIGLIVKHLIICGITFYLQKNWLKVCGLKSYFKVSNFSNFKVLVFPQFQILIRIGKKPFIVGGNGATLRERAYSTVTTRRWKTWTLCKHWWGSLSCYF